jgi:hypothetical protein
MVRCEGRRCIQNVGGENDGKGLLGRPRLKGEDNINMNLMFC